MGWTSEVRFHVGALLAVIRRLRRLFTHKGFQIFFVDFRGNSNYNDALVNFAAYALEKSVQSTGVGVGKAAYGELVYDFSIWKDNICEVAQHFLLLLERSLKEELGKTWRNVKGLNSPKIFVRAYSALGHSEESCFDMKPALLSARGDLKLLAGLVVDLFMCGSCGSEQATPFADADLSKFSDFSAELAALHAECEPDAFRCDNGGKGAKIRLCGLVNKPELNGKVGFIADAVDLETQRWPVRLDEAGGGKELSLISVRRRNLELVNLHIPEDRITPTAFSSNGQSPTYSANVGAVSCGESLGGLQGGYLGKGVTPEKCAAPRKQRQQTAAEKACTPTCCYWLQGGCHFGKDCRYLHAMSATSMCQFGSACYLGHGKSKEKRGEYEDHIDENFLMGAAGLFGRAIPEVLYKAAREQKQLGNTLKAVELLFTAIQVDSTMGPEFRREADRDRANQDLERWAFSSPATTTKFLKVFERVNRSLGLSLSDDEFSENESESGSEDAGSSMYGFGKGMLGFSGSQCDELLMQGIKPWDDDAEAAARVLFGGDEYL